MSPTLLLLIGSLLATQAFANQGFWNAYRSQLFSFLKGGRNPEGMQLLTTPIEAIYDLFPQQQSLADILNPVTKSGPLYQIKTPKDFLPFQYYEFLSNVKLAPIDEAHAQRIERQRVVLKSARDALAEEEKKCDERYATFLEMGMDITLANFRTKYCAGFNRAHDNAVIEEGTLRSYIATAPQQDLRLARTKFMDAIPTESFPWKEGFTSLKLFRERIERRQTNNFRIVINNSEVNSQETKEEWESVDDSFIRNAKGTKFSISKNNSKFTLDIRAPAYYSINVTPDEWFSPRVVENYKKGPFVDAEFAKTFFGPEKRLSKLPTTLHLLYKPEIVLTVGNEEVEFFKTPKTLQIGPFSGEIVSIKKDVSSGDIHQVIVRDTRDHPLIVAIDNKKF